MYETEIKFILQLHDNEGPIKFVRLLSTVILPSLVDLINGVLTKSHYSLQWKVAELLAVHTQWKILERVMLDQISGYTHSNGLLSRFQSGFQSKHSTTTAL